MDEDRSIVFKIGSREPVAVTVADAKHILGHLVGRDFPASNLRSQISRAVRQGGGEVLADEDSRAELALVLDAIDGQGRLTPDERTLHAAAREPIRTTEQ